MTKEQFDLAAEGAGFVQHRRNSNIWKHPDAEMTISRYAEDAIQIVLTEEDNPRYYVRPLSLQRLTHLFKAFQL